MPFQSHLRDFSTPKPCKNCPDCPKRQTVANTGTTQMGRSLPEAAPEVLSQLRYRLHDRFIHSSCLDLDANLDEFESDGRL